MASIEPRPNKAGISYRVIWWEPGRIRQQVTFTDPAEAERFRKLVEGSGNTWPAGWQRPAKAAPPAAAGELTFGQWAERAIANRTRAGDRAKEDYRRDVRLHFVELVPLPLAAIGDDDITRWLEGRRAAKLSVKTIRNLHGFASSLYVDALRQRPPLATHNPFADKLPGAASVHTEEMVFLTPGEFSTVLGNVRAEYHDLIRFLAGTGCRFGEATALTVGDVELLGKRQTVTISKAWKRTGPADWVIGEPKTPRSRRTISISDELSELLIPLTAARASRELVFPGTDGGRLPHIEVYKRGWAPAVARSNVCDSCLPSRLNKLGKPALLPAPCTHPGVLEKTPRIHDLRHSHASWLIAAGVPLAAISRRLGHSSITITVDRYGHLDPVLDDQVNAAIDQALARR